MVLATGWLPWRFGSQRTVPHLAGPSAACLGPACDPLGTNSAGQVNEVRDPFGGVLPGGKAISTPHNTGTGTLAAPLFQRFPNSHGSQSRFCSNL
jgi:hypothetical protein